MADPIVVVGIYRPASSVYHSIVMTNILNRDLSPEQHFDQCHLAVLFVAKVYDACRKAGITPQSATGVYEISPLNLLAEAEDELGLSVPEGEMELANRWKRYEWEWEATRRRRYCYSFLLRVTSGRVVQ